MTREEAIEFIKNIIGEESGRCIGKEGFYAELIGYHIEALKMAIQALSQINDIKAIINNPMYIQEDVLRYQMICEVVKE